MEADRHAIRQFLERVHGPEPTGWLILWTRQDKATRAFNLGEEGALDQAVEYCAARASTFDVYAAVGLQHERPANSSRGAEAGVSVLPGRRRYRGCRAQGRSIAANRAGCSESHRYRSPGAEPSCAQRVRTPALLAFP